MGNVARATPIPREDEGAELIEDAESLAELDRGEIVSGEDVRRQVGQIIVGAEKAHSRQK